MAAKKINFKTDKTPAEVKVSQNATWNLPHFLMNKIWAGLIIAVFAFLCYASTLNHGFTLDDDIVIRQNEFTQQGVKGISGILKNDTFFGFFKEKGKETLVSGGRYRPFSLVVFALWIEFFGDASKDTPSDIPFSFHFLVVSLFALCVWVLYRVVRRLLDVEPYKDKAALIAFGAALLFAAHPVHVEVVANIKGCDETLALLGSLGGLWCVLLAFDKNKYSYALLGAFIYMVGLFSKENAFLWMALTPLALLFFRTKNIGQIVKYVAPLWAAGVFFFIVRGQILNWKFGSKPGDLMNNPFLKVDKGLWVDFTNGEWLGTIFHCLGNYIYLLFAPITLTHDYYPRHIDMYNMTSPSVLLAMGLYGGLIFWAIRAKNNIIRYGIAIYLLTLLIVSNLLFPVGTNMGERFIFMPSVGFCLVVMAVLVDFFQKRNKTEAAWKIPLVLCAVFALLFAVRTQMRNPAWKDNETLFFSDVETSQKSAKLQHACGGITLDKALALEYNNPSRQTLLKKALVYLDRANTIHPTYKDARLNRGNANYHLSNFDAAIKDYREVLRIAPDFVNAKQNLAVALREGGKYYGEKKGDITTALKYLTESNQLLPNEPETMRILGVANGNLGKHTEAIAWFQKVVEQQPENASALFDLGMAYGASGDIPRAQVLQQKALQMDPNLQKKRNNTN